MIIQRQRIITLLGLTSLVATMVTVTRFSSNFNSTQRLVRQVSMTDFLSAIQNHRKTIVFKSSNPNQNQSVKLKLIQKLINAPNKTISSLSSSISTTTISPAALLITSQSSSSGHKMKIDQIAKNLKSNLNSIHKINSIIDKPKVITVGEIQNLKNLNSNSLNQNENHFHDLKRVQYASHIIGAADNSLSSSSSTSISISSSSASTSSLSSSSTSLPIVSPAHSATNLKSSTSMKVKKPKKVIKVKLWFDKTDLKSTEHMKIDKINFCDTDNGATLDLLVIVVSSADHFQARQAIRKTWGQFAVERGAFLLFLLGSTEDNQIQTKIIEEDKQHNDILQGQFNDHYYNLTLKTISMMKWISENCQNVKWVLKVDDDMFVNMQFIADFSETRTISNVIIGKLAKKWKPHRDPHNKWYVPYQAFNGSVFPNFATGPAYIISGDVAGKLYKTAISNNLTPIYLEDVFMTGIVAERAGVKRLNHGLMKNVHVKVDECSFRKIMTSHRHTPEDIIRLWDLVYNQTDLKCENTNQNTNSNQNSNSNSNNNNQKAKNSNPKSESQKQETKSLIKSSAKSSQGSLSSSSSQGQMGPSSFNDEKPLSLGQIPNRKSNSILNSQEYKS